LLSSIPPPIVGEELVFGELAQGLLEQELVSSESKFHMRTFLKA
jgi:hypothetical protein